MSEVELQLDDASIVVSVDDVAVDVSIDEVVVQVNTTGPAGPQGPTILTGNAPPGAAVGTIGQFYLDQTAHILYGPKGTAPVWPVALKGAP